MDKAYITPTQIHERRSAQIGAKLSDWRPSEVWGARYVCRLGDRIFSKNFSAPILILMGSNESWGIGEQLVLSPFL